MNGSTYLYLRERTKLVYSMYSRKPVEEVVANLKSLGVQYAVLENSWCVRRTRYVTQDLFFVLIFYLLL